MKPLKEPINIYEVVVSQTRSVTYIVQAKSSGGASSKALHCWDEADVKQTETNVYDQSVESVEILEEDIYEY